jgi:uncharacterized RDD family membrane protein YckC
MATMMVVPAVAGILIEPVVAGGSRNSGLAVPIIVAPAAVGGLAWCIITLRLVSRNGQTIAKKLLGIKVVRADGSPASLGRIFWLRNVVNGLISAVPILGYFYSIIEVLFIFGETRQCLHDRIADTIVVRA